MAAEGIYTGFVLPTSSASNPVQVWVPLVDKYTPIGEWRTCGKNTLNDIGPAELSIMRSRAKWYYLTQELNGGNYWYNESLGAGTTEQLLPLDKAATHTPDCSKTMDFPLTYNGRCDMKAFPSDSTEPCENMGMNYVLDKSGGTVVDTGANLQNGTFVSMTQWQKVLVALVDEGSTGVVLAVLPWADDYNEVLESVKK